MSCSCPEVYAGSHPTGSKNWNPDCEEHGTASTWYNSDEQQDRRELESIRTTGLQQAARITRETGDPALGRAHKILVDRLYQAVLEQIECTYHPKE